MNTAIVKLLLAIVFCFNSFQSECQKQPALLITAEFTGSGTYHCAYGQDGAYVKLTVKNATASTRSFFVWSCGWATWSINKIVMSFPVRTCDKTIPEEIKLAPGQEVDFYTFVVLTAKNDEVIWTDVTKQFQDKRNEIRFAFTEVTKFEDIENIKALTNQEVGTTYWSEPIAIDLPDNSYRIRPLLTK
ncbi:hypothetical protein GKZ68_05400 [Hymenobacter sp. BRD128]|uniref:hypothetical protein n=1 Tax=Hymenobacter sp. BRD128 TaxID=2675878 RepID=UPI001566068C|nr:hypothetical protein [Hymenobacter sp. BRD128]QKG56126.1 hypothetical protein GKZ68_05400 [Hymenobacter sp. BRD128]